MPNAVLNLVREALFPPLCYGCRAELPEHTPLCGSCSTSLHSRWKTICPVCEKDKTFLQKRRCAHVPGHLSTLSYITLFSQAPVKGLIHTLKYSGITKATLPFKELFEKEKVNLLRIPADVVMPIPLHPRRERERGFNQSEEVAKNVSEILSLPLQTHNLLRRRSAPPQAQKRRRAERMRNIRGLFKYNGEILGGKSVLLIDDVSTSGATLKEAAKVLVENGAQAVHAFVLAREE